MFAQLLADLLVQRFDQGALDGLRVSEVVNMRLNAVNLKQSRVWIKRSKNSLDTEQPLAGDELRALKRYLAIREDHLPREQSGNIEFERAELAEIYVKRGVEPNLARKVALQLMAKDALGAHARDELGISEMTTARPVQAAFTSAATFATGAVLPLLMVLISPRNMLVPVVFVASLLFLALLGAVGAHTGGANVVRATARVMFWGALAMAITAAIGAIFGTVV